MYFIILHLVNHQRRHLIIHLVLLIPFFTLKMCFRNALSKKIFYEDINSFHGFGFRVVH